MHDHLAVQSAIARRGDERIDRDGLEGVVVAGSYDPGEGTIEVVVGDTDAAFGAGTTEREIITATLATGQIGDQYGPIGGERVVLTLTHSGAYVAKLEHGPDDSPQAPMGERWIAHRKPGNGDGPPIWDSTLKVTNDGSPGDGKGGLAWSGGSRHSVQTIDGLQRITEDATKQVRDVAGKTSTVLDGLAQAITHDAGGGTKTIVDGNGRAIAHVAQRLGLGDLFAKLPQGQAAVVHDDLTALASSVVGDTLQSLAKQMASAMGAAGIPNAAAFLAIVSAAGWVTGHVTAPTVPSGSSKVRIA